MSFKAQWQRDKFRKKVRNGFRGFPVATIAYYGPDNVRASKVVVGVIATHGGEPDPLEKWYSDTTDVRTDLTILQKILDLVEARAVKSVVATDRIMTTR